MTENTSDDSLLERSALYLSIRNFWKEYKRHKIGLIGLVMLLFYVGMAVFAPYLATTDPSPTNTVAPHFLAPSWMSIFDPNGVVTGEYMPDPYFVNPPTIVTTGPYADQFSFAHYQNPINATKSYVNLTWSYTANSGVFIQPDPQKQRPDSTSFIYLNQTLHWPYERMPSDVNITFEYGVTLNGDFKTETYGGIMFKVFIWLVDSSGNWRRVYQSSPPYTPIIQDRRINLNYFDVAEAWGGMVLNKQGVQEDPRDDLTVAIGISPTSNFYDFFGDHPWTYYNGSVTLQINELSLVAYGEYYGVLGSTDKGADAWSQLVYGSRISLTIGILSTLLSTFVGVTVGVTAGYWGGRIDEILMRIVDFLLVIPGLPLMMILAAFLGPSVENIIIVIAIFGWTGTSRIMRSQVMAEKNKAYVESARAIGASDTYIMYRHIFPNTFNLLFADMTLGVVSSILSESGLAFLGLTDPSQPSWGRMLADAQGSGGFSRGAWWVVVFPGLMITLLSLAFTFVGHTIDQVLNPRLRER